MSNSKYIRLQELVIDTFNLDAPVEIEKGALLLESTSKTVLLQLRLNVLEDVNEISSTSLNIYGFTDSGEPVEGFSPFTYTFSDVYLQGKKTFGDRTPIILDPRIRKVNFEIEKVVFRTGDVWRNTEGYFTPPTQKPVSSIKGELLPQFERETNLLSQADEKNFLYIPQQFADYWLCTCGRPNKTDAKACSKCGLHREVVFHITNEDYLRSNLQKFNEQARIAEEKRLRAEAENKALIARKKRQLSVVLIALIAIGSLLSLFFFVIQPAIKYNQATSLLTNKDFDGAISAFSMLEDYKDSSEMVKESTYQKAADFLANKKFDDSISIFSSLGEYKDSADLIKESRYQKAVDYLTNAKFDGAISIFSSLSDYEDSAEMVKESNYQKAVSLLNAGEFDNSISSFTNLGDYKDSSDKLLESKYQKASWLLSEQNYDEAISVFTEVKEYLDSKELINEAKYQKGVELFEKGYYSKAYDTLKPISDYEDSNSFVQESLYILGNQDFAAKSYEQAKEKFFQLQDYKDSRNLFTEACYLLAQKQLQDGVYIQAKALFEELGDYKDSELFLAQAVEGVDLEQKYEAAISDYLAGKFTEAKQAFSSLGDFRDSKTYLEKTKVLIGIQGTWGYRGEGDYIGGGNSNMYFVFVGWRVFEIDAGNNVHEHERIIPDQVTASSITIKPSFTLTYTLSSNSLVIVKFYGRTGADQPCYKISNTTNNAKILELLKK